MIEGRKDDGGKLRFDLVPPDALEELVRVYTVGSQKYSPRSWETGISYSRCFAALQRHSWAIWGGEDIDPEDGMPHSAKVAWYGLALSAFRLRGMAHLDDRPSTDQTAEPPIFHSMNGITLKFLDNNAEVEADMRHGERRG